MDHDVSNYVMKS